MAVTASADGTAVVGIHVDAPGGFWASFDDAALTEGGGASAPVAGDVSFDQGLADWTTKVDVDGHTIVETDLEKNHGGTESKVLKVYATPGAAVEAELTRTITGLKPGSYTFSLYTLCGTGAESGTPAASASSFYVTAKSGTKEQAISDSQDWQQNMIADITVAEGDTVTVGIRVKGPANYTALFDGAALTRIPETGHGGIGNPSFESDDLEPWISSNPLLANVKAREDSRTGDKCLEIGSSDTDVEVMVFQVITDLEPGIYTFSIYGQATSAYGEFKLFAIGKNSVEKDAKTGWVDTEKKTWEESGEDTLNQLSGISVGPEGTLIVGIRVSTLKNFWALFDDASLVRIPAYGMLENPSFEFDSLTPWRTTNSKVTEPKERDDSFDGDKTLVFGSEDEAVKADVTQTVKGLKPGIYSFSIYSQAGDNAKELTIYAESGRVKKTQALKTGWKWQENTVSGIEVGSDGKLTVGIHVDAPRNFWAIFDMADLVYAVPNPVVNASFEGEAFTGNAPLSGWTVSGPASAQKQSGAPHGSNVLKVSDSKAYTADVKQTITGLRNGYYYLTACARSTGGQPLSVLYGQGANQSKCMTALPATEGDGALLPIKGQWIQVVVRGIHVTDGTVTVGFKTDAKAGQYVLLDSVALVREPDQSAQFQLEKGGDTSCVSYVEDCGGVYHDADGTAGDPYQLLADNGWDIVRIRLYNNPGKGRGNGSYYCLEGYQDLEDMLLAARRAKDKGLKIQFSFHYSDFWSNGGEQYIPEAWQKQIEGLSSDAAVEILESCVAQYTREVMQALKDQGTPPEYVSFGNEMQGGILYPLGRASTETWPNLARFLNAAYKSAKSVCPETRVILHLDDASNLDKYMEFFDNCEKHKVNYDIIGCSYYPFWTKTSVQSVVDFSNALIERYHKDIIVMETGFGFDDHLAPPRNQQGGQLAHNIPYSDPAHGGYDDTVYSKNSKISKYDGKLPSATPEMQREFMIELFNGLKAIGLGTENRCIGDLYWDPILIEQEGVGWAVFESSDLPDVNAVSNTTLFGFEHQLLPVMDAYRSNREGDNTGAVSGKLQTSGGQGVINAAFTIHLDRDYTVTTDAYGSFRLSGIPAGSYSAAMTAEGLTVESKTVSVTITAGETSQLTLTASAASLSGVVTDDGKKPVSGATVTAVSGKMVHRTLTGSGGKFSFPAIPAGTYTITAEKTGYTPGKKSAAAAVGEPQAVNPQMVLVSGAASGKVTDRYGWPLAGAVVNAGPGLSVKADEQGLYTLAGLLANQPYTLTFSCGGYVSEKKPVSVAKGKTAAVSAELFKDSGVMTGLVTDVGGAPIVGATISLTQNWVPRSETTGEDGRFTMDWLTKGEVDVQVTAEGRVSQGFKCTVIPEGTVNAGVIVLPERLEVKNPSFDPETSGAASEGWTITCTPEDAITYAWRPENSQYDGPYALTLWSASAYKGDVEQAVQLTDAGNYVFRIQGYAGLTYGEFGSSELYIYVKDSVGKELGRTAVPNSDGYVGYEVSFRASEAGAYTLGIHVDAKGGDWAVFDMAELGKVCHPAQRDVEADAWYHEAVDFVLDRGVMNGYGNSLFGTYRELSRAHLAQLLYSLEGKPESAGSPAFRDVPAGSWCSDAVSWAASQGIMSGYGNGRFGSSHPVTREQFVTVLWNYAKSKGQDVSADAAAASGFPDFKETGKFAASAMQWAVGNGVLNGKNGRLEPKGHVTRAQAAQILKNFLDK